MTDEQNKITGLVHDGTCRSNPGRDFGKRRRLSSEGGRKHGVERASDDD